jgi:large subunit ribosomal protein L28
MSKVCHSCGKKPAFGHSRSHSMIATKRRFNPNLQKVRIDDGGRPRRGPARSRSTPEGAKRGGLGLPVADRIAFL